MLIKSNFKLFNQGSTDITSMFILFILMTILISKVYLALNYEINWDEFYYLSFVYKYLNNDELNFFQTFHVHLFSWLKFLTSNEVVQIEYARILMIFFQVLTCFFIFLTARQFFSDKVSILSIITFQTFSYVINHGSSFRTDPNAELFLAITTYCLLKKEINVKDIILTSIFISLAALITTKSILYVPTYFFILFIRTFFIKDLPIYKVCFLICFSTFFLLILSFYHYYSIGHNDFTESVNLMGGAADKTLVKSSFFPGYPYFIYSVIHNPLHWCIALLSIKKLIFNVDLTVNKKLVFLSLSLPMLSILFYRNSFPYFYPFFLAPFSILFCFFWQDVFKSKNKKMNNLLIASFMVVFLFNIYYFSYIKVREQKNDYQKEILNVIHEVFPKKVSYIDRCSMVSSYRKTGFFMSSWGIEDYKLGMRKTIKEAIVNDNPVFYVENIQDLKVINNKPLISRLNKVDVHFLQNNYINFWNQIKIAGKKFEIDEGVESKFMIYIEGLYTLKSNTDVFFDGVRYSNNDVFYLKKGLHTILTTFANENIKIQWGNNIESPKPMDEKPIFTGF